MKRRSFIAACFSAAAGIVVKPILGCESTLPMKLTWESKNYPNLGVVIHDARIHESILDSGVAIELPPLKPGFFRQCAVFCQDLQQIEVVDRSVWHIAVTEASEEARKNGFAELPFPVEPNPFPRRSK
jgi:hypothetical protein